jgi:histidine ammonia-lyase
VILDAAGPTIREVCRIARDGARVELAPEAKQRIRQGRAVVEQVLREGTPVYGLNTGLGAAVDTLLTSAEMIDFQISVTRSHQAAVGPALPRAEVRALMTARLAEICHGGSGVSPTVADGLAAFLNAGIHPVVPTLGSVGAGDLSALAPVANALIGEGFVEYQGEVVPAAQALDAAGLQPLQLREKDGHSFVVVNSLSIGTGCLLLDDLERDFPWSLRALALNFEAFRANLSILDPDAVAARPAFGQVEVGAQLRELMAGSGLFAPGAARRLQDPLSYRCVPQVWGALWHALAEAKRALEIELASPSQNPVVLLDAQRIIPTGNFDLTAFAQSFERLGLALAACASATVQRIIKIMSTPVSDLPRFLTPHSGHSGYGQLQRTSAALEAEIRHLANPLAGNPTPASDGIEDHATMAPKVVAKTAQILTRFRHLIAIELLACAEAVELREVTSTLGAGPREAYDLVRSITSPLAGEQALGPVVTQLVTRLGV